MEIITLKDKVQITDPCYDADVWCTGTLTNVKPGQYVCEPDYTDGRVASIEAVHRNYDSDSLIWHAMDFEVGVDSGQAGIFDYDDFIAHVEERDYDSGDWYSQCCDLTSNEDMCGIINGVGFVSESGYGDGGYTCYTAKNEAGQIVGIKIVFIESDYDDDEDEDDYEDEWPDPTEDEDDE